MKSDDTLFVQVGNAQATDANTAIKSPNAVSIEYLKFLNQYMFMLKHTTCVYIPDISLRFTSSLILLFGDLDMNYKHKLNSPT